jgi:cation transport ATPase
LRLDPRFLVVLLAVFAVLFLTGVGWLAIDQWKSMTLSEALQATSADLLAVHGGVAMIALILIGALLPMHVRLAWRLRKNRVTGTLMLTISAVLVATSFALYYAGAEGLRAWASDLHTAAGLLLPVLVTMHAVLGRRAMRRAWQAAPAAPPRQQSAPAGGTEPAHRRADQDECIT